MTIDWASHQDWQDFAHSLWDERPMVSTQTIAERCSGKWSTTITKNIIVGRARICGWERRPSPIHPRPQQDGSCLPPGGNRTVKARSVGKTLPQLKSLALEPATRKPEPVRCEVVQVTRDPNEPIFRRDGTGCLAVGCGAPLYSAIKPYCATHRDLYYQPKRENRSHDV